jgi:hypothetical protein
VWLPIPTLPEGYDASNLGRVRSWRRPGNTQQRLATTPHLRKQTKNVRSGRLQVCVLVAGKMVCRYVHQLVLEAFRGLRPDGTETRHLNGDDQDNRVGNLAWGTKLENEADKVRHGTRRGLGCGQSKFTASQLGQVKADLAAGVPGAVLARRYKVSQGTISRVKTGVRYAE